MYYYLLYFPNNNYRITLRYGTFAAIFIIEPELFNIFNQYRIIDYCGNLYPPFLETIFCVQKTCGF